jgi:PHD/YefM family antitoxin component YafN of YafNO toxin-antitoxin module
MQKQENKQTIQKIKAQAAKVLKRNKASKQPIAVSEEETENAVTPQLPTK